MKVKTKDLKKDVVYCFDYNDGYKFMGIIQSKGVAQVKNYINLTDKQIYRNSTPMGSMVKNRREATFAEARMYHESIKANKVVDLKPVTADELEIF